MKNDKLYAKFQSDIREHAVIAEKHGARFKLYSNTAIPEKIKQWLEKKKIAYVVLT